MSAFSHLLSLAIFSGVSCAGAGFARETLDLYFIDARLGNAVLVVTPAGEAMLIDAGPAGSDITARILAAMQDAGVKQLDHVVVSHYHWDHFGTIPELAQKVPIRNYVDHGASPWEERDPYWQPQITKQYVATRDKGKHMAVAPGDPIPLKGAEVMVVASGGGALKRPLPGAGGDNPACWLAGMRAENRTEDGESVAVVVSFGQFRFADFGDLTWNNSVRLFCPENKVGPVDLYLITHHAMSMDDDMVGAEEGSSACCPPAEVYGLRPRVAILSAPEAYIFELGTPEAFQRVRLMAGLEDIWQTHYQGQGGDKNNAPEAFIACPYGDDCQGGDWIKVSAREDGSFTVTNKRNGFTKTYPARERSR
jgi:beta-lactamase superfamily II metal-dependent hydrolase